MKIWHIFFAIVLSMAIIPAVEIGQDNSVGVIIRTVATVAATFLELTDTPSSYSGQSGLCVIVNSGETGLSFLNCSNASGGHTVDTQKDAEGYLFNDTTTIFLNGTLLNITINQLENDTQKDGQGYLFNDTTTIFLNGTLLNQTINQLENDTIFNNTNVAYINNTQIFTGTNTFTSNVNVTQNIILEISTINITQNTSCLFLNGPTSRLEIC